MTGDDTPKTVMLVGGSLRAFLLFRLPLIRDLVAQGLNVHCVCWGNAGRDENPVIEGTTWTDLGGNHIASAAGDVKPFVRLMKLLRLVRPETVLCFNAKPIFYGGIASRLTSERTNTEFAVLMEGRGIGLDFVGRTAWQQRGKTALLKFAARSFMRWIFLNGEDEQVMRGNRMLRDSARSLQINGIGVDLSRFVPAQNPAAQWEQKSCTFLGRLIREKGPDQFAEIARLVKSRMLDVQFHIAGQRSDLPSEIPANEVSSWLRRGDIDTIQEYARVENIYRKTAIAVLPTRYNEGLPTIAMEAQAMGIPILLSDIPQNRLALADGETGHLIPPNRTDVYADHIVALLSDAERYAAMSVKCREYAVEHFDQQATNRQISAFLLDR